MRSISAKSGFALVGLSTAVASACAPDRPPRSVRTDPLAGTLLSDVRCAHAVAGTVKEWGAASEYLIAAPGAGQEVSYRFPTSELGVWVVVSVSADGRAEVVRVSAEASTRRSFGAACMAAEHELEAARPSQGVLDDEALQRALEQVEGSAAVGVLVYAWSPHMPLSVDGWPEAEAAGQALGLLPIPALIGHADLDFARREAERVGMPEEGLREITALELVMRDAQVHAPSIVVFSDGRVSPVLPGYRNDDGYRRFLRPFLDAGS